MNYTDIMGWVDYESAYDQAVNHFNAGTFVEVGTYLGRSLVYLADRIKKSRKNIRVVGVDHCIGSGVEQGHTFHADAVNRGGGSFASELHTNIIKCGVSDIVDLFITSSKNAASYFPDHSIQFVFLDAAHDYDNVRSDILTWLPKIVSGGWLGGDDLCPIWPDIEKALKSIPLNYQKWSHDSWLYKVP